MMPITSHFILLANEANERAVLAMQGRDFHNARYEIERAYHTFVSALRLEQDSPSPAPSPRPVTVAAGLSPDAVTPAGAASPSKSGTGGSLIDLPEEVPFQ